MFRVFESYGLELETKSIKSSYPLSIKDERKTRALCEQRGLLVWVHLLNQIRTYFERN